MKTKTEEEKKGFSHQITFFSNGLIDKLQPRFRTTFKEKVWLNYLQVFTIVLFICNKSQSQFIHIVTQPALVVNSVSLAFTDFTKQSATIIGVKTKSQPYLTGLMECL